MRRMRDIPWHYYLIILPAIAIPFGVRTIVKQWNADSVDSHRFSDVAAAAREARNRSLASLTSAEKCSSVEFLGQSAKTVKVEKKRWNMIMDQFHSVKDDMLAWISEHRDEMSPATYAALEKQVKGIRLQRPPAEEDPELSWRGIGIWTEDSHGPVIRVGAGFISMFEKSPARGRFELTRLVAQAWSPCYLSRVDVAQPWTPLLQCLGVQDQSCTPGAYSESGWAVSTAVAQVVSSPGCTVPIRNTPRLRRREDCRVPAEIPVPEKRGSRV